MFAPLSLPQERLLSDARIEGQPRNVRVRTMFPMQTGERHFLGLYPATVFPCIFPVCILLVSQEEKDSFGGIEQKRKIEEVVFVLSGFKKSLLVVMILAGVLLGAQGVSASVGFVDFEFLFNAHPEYDMRNKELQHYAEELAELFQKQREELATEKEAEALALEFEREFDNFADNLRLELVESVQKFIAEVAKKMGISVVLPHTTIIYGGVDLTPTVIEAMYHSYGISVPRQFRLGE